MVHFSEEDYGIALISGLHFLYIDDKSLFFQETAEYSCDFFGKSYIVFRLSLCGRILLFSIMCPKYLMEEVTNLHFTNFNLKPKILIAFNTFLM